MGLSGSGINEENHIVSGSWIASLIDDSIGTILSMPFCPYHFVPYHFVLEPHFYLLLFCYYRLFFKVSSAFEVEYSETLQQICDINRDSGGSRHSARKGVIYYVSRYLTFISTLEEGPKFIAKPDG